MKRLVVLVVMILILTSCVPEGVTVEQPDIIKSNVTRFIDEEAGVVCWEYDGYRSGGISCLPIDETKLGQGGVGR